MTERIGVGRGNKVEREAKTDNGSMKKRGRPAVDMRGRVDQGQGGSIRYGKLIDKHDWTGKIVYS